jgi:two-component system phosphate regulon sensor histidine kinase PhoR
MIMDWFLGILALFLLITVTILAWRYGHLQKRLAEYNNLLRRTTGDNSRLGKLPVDFPGVEDLSNAVRNLAQEYTNQLTTVEVDRIRLSSILDKMTDGVIIADYRGQVSFINPAAQRIFRVQNVVGHRVPEVLHHFQLVEAWQRCITRGDTQDETVELPAQRIFLHLIAVPDSRTGDVLLLVQDLTPLRRLESVRRDFISNVSHELRTPLASLKALTETLRDGALEDSEAAPRFLARMETEVDALTQMTQELLDLSRIESGQINLELLPVHPSRLLHTCAERMQAQAERANLSIKVDLPPDLPEVRGDRARLEQVLVNLIHNAIKFTPPGGTITLSAAVEGKSVRFSVSDTGQGIPEEDLERIFERFYKSDRARSGGGTGLGLSISRHIIEAHGGHIGAQSREGRGSTFHFNIPLA